MHSNLYLYCVCLSLCVCVCLCWVVVAIILMTSAMKSLEIWERDRQHETLIHLFVSCIIASAAVEQLVKNSGAHLPLSLSLFIYTSLCLALSLLHVVIASRLWVTCHSQRTCCVSFSRVQSRRTFVKFAYIRLLPLSVCYFYIVR